jgi:CBS domain-containing protein
MKARDVMASPVITVQPGSSVREVAKLFVERHISGAPVVDDGGKIVGIVSEGDLLHRRETGTQRRRSWWLHLLARPDTLAADYVREHAPRIADVMSRDVVSVGPDTALRDIAQLLEARRIKRVPVVENGQLVGIVSRANLVQALASASNPEAVTASDSAIRDKLVEHLKHQPWARDALVNVTVADGVVGLWGVVRSDAEHRALRVAAEATPGVVKVDDHLAMRPFAYDG